MAAEPLVVHCIYKEDGPVPEEIILEAFRIFLKKELDSFAKPSSEDVL